MLQALETPNEVEHYLIVDDGLSVKCFLLLKIAKVFILMISSMSQTMKEKIQQLPGFAQE